MFLLNPDVRILNEAASSVLYASSHSRALLSSRSTMRGPPPKEACAYCGKLFEVLGAEREGSENNKNFRYYHQLTCSARRPRADPFVENAAERAKIRQGEKH